jgi:hypothetical protein
VPTTDPRPESLEPPARTTTAAMDPDATSGVSTKRATQVIKLSETVIETGSHEEAGPLSLIVISDDRMPKLVPESTTTGFPAEMKAVLDDREGAVGGKEVSEEGEARNKARTRYNSA